MRLPLPSFSKKDKPQYLLAALLRDDLIKVIIFEETEGKIKVITTHTEHFSTPLEEATMEEWTDTFDKAIGTAENVLPEHAELKKTVFGVKQSWVEGTKIKKEYLTKLKKISDTLDLQPIGFLIFSEAIIHLLQKEQGAPVSGILVEIGKHTAITSIIRAGRIIESKTTPIESTVVAAVESALKQITDVEILPSKMLLFDGADIDTIAQAFISYPWNKTLPFLHVPQITVLSDDFDAKAIIYGTSVQLDMHVDDEDLQATITTPKEKPKEKEPELAETPPVIPETKKKTADEPIPLKNPAYFGFVINQDIAASPVQPEEPLKETPANIPDSEPVTAVSTPSTPLTEPVIANPVLAQPFPIYGDRKSRRSINKLAILIPAILLLLIITCIWYFMNLRAIVELSITPKIIDASQTATFSTKDDNNFSGNIVRATTVTVSEDGSVSTNTTGTKDIGDKAKGTVTIFNSGDASQTITAGTIFTSANGLKFTADKDVTVASASGDIFSGTKPGTADAAVTASDIGPDSNLPSGTKFTISDSSTIAAKNNSDFSGGTKKQATVVSKTDITKLTDDLLHNLEDKAKEDLNKQVDNGTGVLPVITNEVVTKQKADKKVGDEAKAVTLNGTVSYTSLSYNKDDLISYGKLILKDKTSENLSSESLMTAVTDATSSAATNATATVKVNASLQPEIDIKQITQTIKGKSVAQAIILLSHNAQISNTRITFSPNIPFIPKLLPLSEKNIKVTIQTK